jgi:hypothetical protein
VVLGLGEYVEGDVKGRICGCAVGEGESFEKPVEGRRVEVVLSSIVVCRLFAPPPDGSASCGNARRTKRISDALKSATRLDVR